MSERGLSLISERDDAVVTAALRSLDTGGDLFVINLCASMTPVHVDQQTLPSGVDRFKLYQVSRMEDGRRRYRLRLGFFHTESAAEDVLVAVRSRFATAFTTCLCNEDLKSASVFLKRPLHELQHEFDTQRTGRFKVSRPLNIPTMDSSATDNPIPTFADAKLTLDQQLEALIDQQLLGVALTDSTPAVAPPVRSQPKPTVVSAPAKNSSRSELTASTPPVGVSPQRVSTNNQFHVGSGVNIPDSGLSLTPDQHTLPKVKPANGHQANQAAASLAAKSVVPAPARSAETKSNSQVAAPISKAPVAAPTVARTAPVVPSNGWRQESNDGVPTLDTTQTIHALTKSELEDANVAKWFVVQLAVSDHAINLDTMPHLDIFEAYALYSVSVMAEGGVRHSLRLGFFSEEVSAQAVMGYLRTFFGSPTIERVSKTEHERFVSSKQKPVEKAIEQRTPAAQPDKLKGDVVTFDAKRSVTAPAAKQPIQQKPIAAKPVTKTVNTPQGSPPRSGAMSPVPRVSTTPVNRPIAPSPEVSMPAIRPMVTTRITGKYAAPAVRHARQGTGNTNMPLSAGTNAGNRTGNKSSSNAPFNGQVDLLDDAALLGLSDSQILRVKSNPSLLSRLVNKLTR
jgi:hypothetical protein